jgi:hypothetical protein|tara:strand:+ start:488 stop:901 length:414 start_codon:yes stop_codon:yes gene_type:complete
MKTITQGAKANLTGKTFELQCEALLEANGIEFETQVPYTNLYGSSRCKIDIVVNKLHIECKYQEGSGSVDEKIPFCLYNLEQFGGGLLILGGAHWESTRGKTIRKWANDAKASGLFSSTVITFEEWKNDLKFFLTND